MNRFGRAAAITLSILVAGSLGGIVTALPQTAFAVSCLFGSPSGSQCIGFITSGTSWSVPADWSGTNTIEVIGAGQDGSAGGKSTGKNGANYGGAGGAGGDYSKISNVSGLSGSVTISVGVNGTTGGDTYFNGSSCSGSSACAKGGGSSSSDVGATQYAGGAGGVGASTSGGGGGGGAAGPNGAGGSGSVTIGGQGDNGYGGTDNSAGTEWTSYGSGGGGDGSASGSGTNGGAYGAGGGGGFGNGSSGGTGTGGLIVITYTPTILVPTQPGTPTYSGQSASTPGNVTVNWTSSSNATFYDVDRATASGGPYSFVASTTATSYSDSGLSANTTYWYEVQGLNTSTSGPWSAYSSVLTYPNQVSSAPTYSSITTSGATANWTAPSGGADYYDIYDATASGGPYSFVASTTATNMAVSGSTNTEYWYYVQGANGTGAGLQSPTSTFWTLANSPSAPTVGSPTYSTLTLTNFSNGNPSGTSFAFYVSSTSPSDPNFQGYWITSANGTSTSPAWIATTTFTAGGLQPNTTYSIAVEAENGALTATSLSGAGSGLTLPGAPGTPSFSNVTTTSLTASWTAPTNGASYYNLDYATASGGPYSFYASTTATSKSVSGLTANTTYWFEVQGVASGGAGPWSSSGSATTASGGASNSPPNAPSMDSPTNGVQDEPTTPVFKMTATDPDNDNLEYKVTIYSNSGCSSAVQTDDETQSQAGWSGQNATSSSPGDSYTSGTQGTFTVQTALSQNVTYYWQAAAIDPLGSDTWTAASNCYAFTTTYGNWTTDSGSWSVSNGTLVVTPAAGSNVQIRYTGSQSVVTSAMVDVEVEASAVGANTGSTAAILRADTGANRYQFPEMDAENGLERIGMVNSGSYTSLTSASFSWSANTFYDLRAYVNSGQSLDSWVNGANALSTTNSSFSSGYAGLEASSTGGGVTFTYDDFALYSSPTITLNGLPSGGSWSVRDHSGTVLSCNTGSTWNLSTVAVQVPIDYANGGGSVAVWAANSTCNGSPSAAYPASGLATDIFGGDTYSYGTSSAATGGSAEASSTITVNSAGLITF